MPTQVLLTERPRTGTEAVRLTFGRLEKRLKPCKLNGEKEQVVLEEFQRRLCWSEKRNDV